MLSLLQGCVGCWQSTSCSSRQERLPWESQLLPRLGRDSCAEGRGQTVPFLIICDPSNRSSVLRKPSLGNNFPFEHLCSPTGQFLALVRHSSCPRYSPGTSSRLGKGGRSLQSTGTLSSLRAWAGASTQPACTPVWAPQLQLSSLHLKMQQCMGCTAPLPHGAQGNQHHSPHPSLGLLPSSSLPPAHTTGLCRMSPPLLLPAGHTDPQPHLQPQCQ